MDCEILILQSPSTDLRVRTLTVVHNPQFDKLFYKAGCYGSTKLAINNLQFINISFMQILILSLIKTSLTV